MPTASTLHHRTASKGSAAAGWMKGGDEGDGGAGEDGGVLDSGGLGEGCSCESDGGIRNGGEGRGEGVGGKGSRRSGGGRSSWQERDGAGWWR